MSSAIETLLREKKVIVCCGAGGVGKTTTAASLAVAGAKLGRKVLVLTIDPSKRLAETLGVAQNPPAPVPVPEDRLRAAGIQAPASLHAWMLDPKVVADEAVRGIVRNPEEAQKLLDNRIYQQLTQMVAGMHEYTAMKALHRFVKEGHYDLVILDTPPSRHALDFLDAPNRVRQFLEGKIFKMFLPSEEQGFFRRAASGLVHKILSTVFSEEFAESLTVFFGSFTGVFQSLNTDLGEMRQFLREKDVAFLLVTSPAHAALTEAFFFQDKTEELGLPLAGFVLNRSQARGDGRVFPSESLLPADAGADGASALKKLQELAQVERAQAEKDQSLLSDLAERARKSSGGHGFAQALPWLNSTDEDGMTMLLTLIRAMMGQAENVASGPAPQATATA